MVVKLSSTVRIDLRTIALMLSVCFLLYGAYNSKLNVKSKVRIFLLCMRVHLVLASVMFLVAVGKASVLGDLVVDSNAGHANCRVKETTHACATSIRRS